MSLLYRLTPDQCKFIMIDPKMLELSVYDDIPHLLAPVVTEPKKAIVALKWVVREMENRYRAMSKLGVRNIEGYNQRLEQARVVAVDVAHTELGHVLVALFHLAHGPFQRDHRLHLLVGDEGAVDAGDAPAAGHVEHVALAQELLGAHFP